MNSCKRQHIKRRKTSNQEPGFAFKELEKKKNKINPNPGERREQERWEQRDIKQGSRAKGNKTQSHFFAKMDKDKPSARLASAKGSFISPFAEHAQNL